MFDIFFILTILATMYVTWYGYNAPSGASRELHAIAAISAVWLTGFFVYYMVAESTIRPAYHTVAICLYYCMAALTYATLYYRGCIEERNKLRDKSR